MSSGGIRAGQAFIELGIRDRLEEGLAKAQGKLKSFGTVAAGIGAGMIGAGAGIAAPLVAATVKFAAYGAELSKVSARTGATAEELSALGYAAEKTGTPIDTLHEGLTEMTQRLGEAAITGTGSAADQLKLLGLSADELVKKNPVDALGEITDAVNKLETQGERNFALDEIFGGDSRQMSAVLALGSKGLAGMRSEAEALGHVLSGEDMNAAKELTQSTNLAKLSLAGITKQIGAALAPALTIVANLVTTVATNVAGFIKNNRGLVVGLGVASVALIAGGAALVALGGAAALAGMALGGVTTILGFLASPVVLIAGGIALLAGGLMAAGAAALYFSGVGGDAVAWVMQKFGALKAFLGPILKGISDALASGDMALAAKIGFAGVRLAFWTGLQKLPAAVSEATSTMVTALKDFFQWSMGAAELAGEGMSKLLSAGLKMDMASVGFEVAGIFQEIGRGMGDGSGKAFETQRAAAEADLKRLIAEAAAGRPASTPGESEDTEPTELVLPPELDQALTTALDSAAATGQQMDRITSSGTFSGFAAGRMSGQAGQLQERIADATERAAVATEKTVAAIEKIEPGTFAE